MSRDGNDSAPSRQNNFSLLCFWTISSRAGESYTYTYTSAWKTGILLTKLPSETKINAHPFATDSPCLPLLSVTPESPENMKTTALHDEFLFSANRAWNCANTVMHRLIRHATRSYFLRSLDASFTTSLTSISIFRIKNNQCHTTRFYIPLYFTLYVIKENWSVIFTVFL